MALGALTAIALAACGAAATVTLTAQRARALARWQPFVHAPRPLDLVGPRRDGSMVLAASGRMYRLSRAGKITPFASGARGYRSPGGEEPYIALSPGGCFGTGSVFAIRLTRGRGVVKVEASGAVRRLAFLREPGLIDGIAFDTTGHFGGALLVTINAGQHTTVVAIGCHGAERIITRVAPRVEGGIAVAPLSFGRFAGDLIASSEATGNVFAVTPKGRSLLVARSGLPHGGDVGVESEAFVPSGMRDAVVADRLTPGNPHPGDDVVLRLRAAALRTAGVHPGELLVATEGSAFTDAISCSSRGCSVHYVARGPAVAHVEGHIAFLPAAR